MPVDMEFPAEKETQVHPEEEKNDIGPAPEAALFAQVVYEVARREENIKIVELKFFRAPFFHFR